MMFSSAAEKIEEVATLFQYLYESPYNNVIFNLGDDGVRLFNDSTDIQMSLDKDFNVLLSSVECPEKQYQVSLSLKELIKVVDYLHKDKAHIQRKDLFDTRWKEIAFTVMHTLLTIADKRIEAKTFEENLDDAMQTIYKGVEKQTIEIPVSNAKKKKE